MVQSILVLGKGAPYDFVPEGQTARLTGQKVHFIMRDAPLAGVGADGFQPISSSLPLTEAEKIKDVPAIYSAAFSVTVKSCANGQALPAIVSSATSVQAK